MALVAYFALLGVWALFLPPLWRGPRASRVPLAIAAAAGALALTWELWVQGVWSSRTSASIRLDVPVLVVALVAADAWACRSLWRHGARRACLPAAGIVVAAGGLFAVSWIAVSFEGRRLDGVFDEGHRLLFEAKFRDRETYASVFGVDADARGEDGTLPIGHWESEDAPVFRRLVVSPDERVFLFYRCGPTECSFGSGTRLVPAAGPGPDRWTATLVEAGPGERSLVLGVPEAGSLLVGIDGRRHRFRATPPPLLGAREPEALVSLGAFSSIERAQSTARVSQVWLWRDAGGGAAPRALHAVGIFRRLTPGVRADFVTPVILGQGVLAQDGSWRFRWAEAGRELEARIRLESGADRLLLELPGQREQWPSQTLRAGSIFHDEVIELASRTSPEDWRHWLETLLVGHFSAAEIPELPPDPLGGTGDGGR